MSALRRLHEHNAWANGRLLEACGQAAPGALEPPGGESLIRKLRHMAAVEASFIAAIRGEVLPSEIPRTLDALAAMLTTAEAGLAAVASGAPGTLTAMFRIPWFKPEFEVQDGLLQVIGHSAQHRAEIAADLARAGIDTGNLDYIHWLQLPS